MIAFVIIIVLLPQAEMKSKVTCVRTQEDYELEDHVTKKTRNIVNYEASCKITMGNEVIRAGAEVASDGRLKPVGKLPLGHPATRREAQEAIDRFIDETAPRLVKEWQARKEERNGKTG